MKSNRKEETIMKLKKRWIILALLLLIIILILATCFGGKKLKPGTYEVTQAVYEVKDGDYELDVKGYGEYDVKALNVIEKPGQSVMQLEIKPDNTHNLYVNEKDDVIIDNSSDSGLKLKKKKKR
jgi:hypothetical protein